MAVKKGEKIKVQDLKPKKDAKGGFEPNIPGGRNQSLKTSTLPEQLWIVDAHYDYGKRFVVRADKKLTAFLELEAAIAATANVEETTLANVRALGPRTSNGLGFR